MPTHKPVARDDRPDKVYRNETGKLTAVAREIKDMHQAGRPVLVGTVSIEKNEHLSALLKMEGVPHNVLNAKNHEQDAEIVAQAGRRGAVTVATNIAGRGVDIILGGHPKDADAAEEVRRLGGLHVIGTERHEARRIDNQLRGRSGRQGDPGSSQFFVSLEDDLMRIFGGDKVKGLMERMNIPEDEAIKSGIVTKAIEGAQERIEGHHFDARKHVLQFDEVINKHREAIYSMRRALINPAETEASRALAREMVEEEVREMVSAHATETGVVEYEEIVGAFRRVVPFPDEETKELVRILTEKKSAPEVEAHLLSLIERVYKAKEKEVGEESMRQIERMVLLRV
ncbi:MAG TPA: preprotein translocase subunit SecA, partial [Candidatus Paceibacterota bacterium]